MCMWRSFNISPHFFLCNIVGNVCWLNPPSAGLVSACPTSFTIALDMSWLKLCPCVCMTSAFLVPLFVKQQCWLYYGDEWSWVYCRGAIRASPDKLLKQSNFDRVVGWQMRKQSRNAAVISHSLRQTSPGGQLAIWGRDFLNVGGLKWEVSRRSYLWESISTGWRVFPSIPLRTSVPGIYIKTCPVDHHFNCMFTT